MIHGYKPFIIHSVEESKNSWRSYKMNKILMSISLHHQQSKNSVTKNTMGDKNCQSTVGFELNIFFTT